MNRRQCRGCGKPLTTDNARRWQGRWVGACKECEADETRQRKARKQPMVICPTCGHRRRLAEAGA